MKALQKLIKYFALAFAAVLIVGIFTSVYKAGFVVASFIDGNNGADISSNVSLFDGDENSSVLDIQLSGANLIILPGDKLEVKTNAKEKIKVSQEHNKIIVTENVNEFFNFEQDAQVVITVPKDMTFDWVSVSGVAGFTNIKTLTAKSFYFEMVAGKNTIDNLTVTEKTQIEGTAGKTVIDNADLHNLNLDIGIGSLTLDGKLTGNCRVDLGIGKFNINLTDGRENYQIFAETGIGAITADSQKILDDEPFGNGDTIIDINGGIGSIKVEFEK